jgi:hypothetical protein
MQSSSDRSILLNPILGFDHVDLVKSAELSHSAHFELEIAEGGK